MLMNELKEKIQEDRGVQVIRNILMGMVGQNRLPNHRNNHHSNIKLAGGAVIDILEDRTPKDYDIVNAGANHIAMFEAAGFVFVSDSKTAVTYERNAMIIQFLKIRLEEFEFRI